MPVFSKSKNKTPHFFCESCGAEVPRNAKNCPKCGSAFASVLCPGCGFSGEEALFKNGCPVCGYSSGASLKFDEKPADFHEKLKPAGALPVWAYILSAAGLAAVLAGLFFAVSR